MSVNGPQKPVKDFGASLTVQGFKDRCDINKIMAKYAKTGTISHLAKYEPQYGDVQSDDLLESMAKVKKAEAIFAELPGEVRREFGNDPVQFFKFVNEETNKGNLKDVLPKLAAPGVQMPDVLNQNLARAIQRELAAADNKTAAPEAPAVETPPEQ